MPATAAATAAGVGSASMKKGKPEPIPVMDYRQYRRARRLVHECCNYDGGNCIALDDGKECVCVQSISYSLLCRCQLVYILILEKRGQERTFRVHAVFQLFLLVCQRPQDVSLRPHFIAKSFRTLTKKPGTAKAIPDYFGSGKRT